MLVDIRRIFIEYLERILEKVRVERIRALTAYSFGDDNVSGRNRRNVEAHMQVGGVSAALHIEHLHLVSGIILKDVFALGKILGQIFVNLLLRRVVMLFPVVFGENLTESGMCHFSVNAGSVFIKVNVTGTEVDGTHLGRVNTAEIKNQLIINIQPEVIVTGELKDDVMSPSIQSGRRLYERRLHFHTEVVVCFSAGVFRLNEMKLFVFSGIGLRQLSHRTVFGRCKR